MSVSIGWVNALSRYTVAYSSLVSRLEEVETLAKMARNLERSEPIKNSDKINALCRGAVVLLSSHVEGYTKEIGELTLTKIFEQEVCRSKISNTISYYASHDLISKIKDTSDREKIAAKIVDLTNRDLSLWEQTGPHPNPISEERFNKSFASPSYDKISAYFGRFGYAEYKRDLGRNLGSDFLAAKNMINHVVDIRNKIAHGDSTVSQTPSDVLNALPIVKQFCRVTDTLFASWCRSNLCHIR